MKTKTIIIFLLSLSQAFAADLALITPKDADQMLKKNQAIIIDVREPNETTLGAVLGTEYIPLSLLTDQKNEFDKKVSTLPKDKTIIVYCRSGRRSGILGAELEKKGYKVLNMGAFDAWKAAGFKTEEKKCPTC